jgi:hypothetical protein
MARCQSRRMECFSLPTKRWLTYCDTKRLHGGVRPRQAVMSIRVLHHWTCSGGTILSRCIATHPDVVLLSELHPLAYLRHRDVYPDSSSFHFPNDILWQLCLPHNGRDPAFCLAAWNGAIDGLYQQLREEDKFLVIRSHSHVDFFTGIMPADAPLVATELARRHTLEQLITVRHPLDSWLSLCKQGWQHHFRFSSFTEYCKRCLAMLDACKSFPLLRYEDFCVNPYNGFRTLCSKLGLPEDVDNIFSLENITVSGDSGRSGNKIGARGRRPLPDRLAQTIKKINEGDAGIDNHPYATICERLNYNPDPLSPHPFTTGAYHG